MKLKGHERQEKGNKLIKNQRRQLTIYVLSKMTVFLLDNCRYPLYFITYSRKDRGTQREYSSKPLKHSIVKRMLVFKR